MNVAKSERVHIGFFGRVNVGKSSIVNIIANQDISIVSSIAGTTTDTVEKTMELAELGPVVLIDTAGVDDTSNLAYQRKTKTDAAFLKCDFAFLIVEPNIWTEFETSIIENFKLHNIKFAAIINKIDADTPTANFLNLITNSDIIQFSVLKSDRNIFISKLIQAINKELQINSAPSLFDGLIEAKDFCLFVTPIDSGAPKGRIITPQVQALRAILDKNAAVSFVQLSEYQAAMANFIHPPKLVVTDSQVVKEVIELSAKQQAITTFSILLAKMKGDFQVEVNGAKSLASIQPNDTILIAEACSHHAQKDDIALIKIPKLLEKYLHFKPNIEYCNGRDFPTNLSQYHGIIHCGACMLTQKEKLNRIQIAQSASVPITNFGLAISFLTGYFARVLEPFNLQSN